jgi:transposase-like protein
MNNGNSPYRADVQERLQLLRAEEAGQMEGIACPQCKQATVSVWFTHPAKNEFRTWFVCETCGFSMRTQNTGRPAHYSEERDRTGRAEYHEPVPLSPKA